MASLPSESGRKPAAARTRRHLPNAPELAAGDLIFGYMRCFGRLSKVIHRNLASACDSALAESEQPSKVTLCFGPSGKKHGNPRRVKPVGVYRFWGIASYFFRAASCFPTRSTIAAPLCICWAQAFITPAAVAGVMVLP